MTKRAQEACRCVCMCMCTIGMYIVYNTSMPCKHFACLFEAFSIKNACFHIRGSTLKLHIVILCILIFHTVGISSYQVELEMLFCFMHRFSFLLTMNKFCLVTNYMCHFMDHECDISPSFSTLKMSWEKMPGKFSDKASIWW